MIEKMMKWFGYTKIGTEPANASIVLEEMYDGTIRASMVIPTGIRIDEADAIARTQKELLDYFKGNTFKNEDVKTFELVYANDYVIGVKYIINTNQKINDISPVTWQHTSSKL